MKKVEKRTSTESEISAHMRNIRALIEEAVAGGGDKTIVESSITIARGGVRDKKALSTKYILSVSQQ